MKRISILAAAGALVATSALGAWAAFAATDDNPGHDTSQVRVVASPSRRERDATAIATTSPVTAGHHGHHGEAEPGDDHGGQGQEPGDDHGGQGSEPGDDNGGHGSEPGDDNGGHGQEPGDDHGGHGQEPGDDNGGHGHHGGDDGDHGHHGGDGDASQPPPRPTPGPSPLGPGVAVPGLLGSAHETHGGRDAGRRDRPRRGVLVDLVHPA